MVKILSCALVTLSLCQVVYLSPVLTAMQGNEMQEDDFEKDVTNQLIDEIKTRILKSLNRVEAPRTHVSVPRLQTLSPEDEWENNREAEKTETETDFLHADVENASCEGQPCFKFHFNLQSPKDFRSAELWLYKKEGISEFFIRHTISINEEEKETFTTTVHNQSHLNEWTRFDVSHIVNVANITALDFQVSTGNSEQCLETEDDKKPFLLIHKDISARSISKRSASDCTNESSVCCRRKYYIKFEDMGWSDWIIQPEGYEANYCQGSCANNIDLLINHHATVMRNLCEKKPHKGVEMNKTECVHCTPASYGSISIIYLDEQNLRVVSHMPNTVVRRCGCA